ncbi:MAG: ABC transporter permease subunit [Sedimentisphaerales bacterium]|nr:ABC transporter permease subunit [Sedimentisphaerales bacterium]
MMYNLITIAKNTLVETLRQPVYAVIIFIALLLFLVSPSLSMYTMDDDNKLLREIGLSTLFLTSLFIAIFSASGAVSVEIENKTVMTVLTKPVQRPIFILAKFLGVLGALGLAHYICTVALLMAIRHGVLETASDTHDWTVIAAAGVIAGLTILLSAFFNFIYDWKFGATAVVTGAILSTFGLVFLVFIDRTWKFNPAENGIHLLDIYGSILLFLAAIIIAALAVAISSRFNMMVTLSACMGLFLLGLVSDYVFGRFAETHIWARIGRFLVPNLQVFWISDAIYEGTQVPARYIFISGSYAVCYTVAILALAVALFQRRQVG